MKWSKRGLIFGPDGSRPWAHNSALQPTPLLRGDVIRVFVGFRDANGRSSVGYVDVAAADPSRVLKVSDRPVLAPGAPTDFDGAGVVPCAIVEDAGTLRMYYAGYQPPRAPNERFRVFAGLAVSTDGGETFRRLVDEPVMQPGGDGPLFRVIHSIHRENGVWRVWYGAGKEFWQGRNKLLPVYDIRYCESEDGVRFPTDGEVAIPLGEGEHRVGRPYVVRAGSGYQMYFGGGREQTTYRLAYAESSDGRSWTRRDAALGLDVTPGAWDSEMMAYPAVVAVGSNTYLFYNGNQYGRAGFGYALLTG